MNNIKFKFTGMTFTIEMDRQIAEKDADDIKYYISPGGYELKNHKKFDFMEHIGYVDKNNRKLIHFEVKDIDEDITSENETELNSKDLKLPFEEFFIFTGEYDDPEINVVKIISLNFNIIENDVEKTITATKEQLKSINDYFIAN